MAVTPRPGGGTAVTTAGGVRRWRTGDLLSSFWIPKKRKVTKGRKPPRGGISIFPPLDPTF